MNDHEHDSSSRRSFLKTAALAGFGCVPSSQSQIFVWGATRSLLGIQRSPFLDPEDEVRVGLIGLTGHFGIVMDAIPLIRGARLEAIALTDGERMSEGLQFGGRETVCQSKFNEIRVYPAFKKNTRLYKTYQEMLAEEHLDVVASCLPYRLNAHASMAAARKGCHVISGEPLATDLKALAALESVVRETRVQISAMLEMRLRPGVAAMRKAIAAGLIGEPVLAFARKSYAPGSDRPESSRYPHAVGGAFPWIGIHALDCISYTTGLQVTQTSALQRSKTNAPLRRTDENAGIMVKLSNGSTGILSLNDSSAEDASSYGGDRLRVAGTHGVVEMTGERVQLITRNHPPEELPLPPHRSVVESFVSFLRGQGPHVMTSEEAFRVTRVCVLARRAAEEGRVLMTHA